MRSGVSEACHDALARALRTVIGGVSGADPTRLDVGAALPRFTHEASSSAGP